MEFNLCHFYPEHAQRCPGFAKAIFYLVASSGIKQPQTGAASCLFAPFTSKKKMKNLAPLFLLILLIPRTSGAQPYDHYKYAISGTASGFLFAGAPYLATLTFAGLKYDFIFANTSKNAVPYLSTGLQAMVHDSESYIAIPAELCYGADLQIFSVHIGAGGILHAGGTYLQPAIFFTAHGNLRFKFGQSPIFLDLEARLLNTYKYEYLSSSSGPTTRTGSAVSLGLGFSVGGYIR